MAHLLQSFPLPAGRPLHRLPIFRRAEAGRTHHEGVQGHRMQSVVIHPEADRVLWIWRGYKLRERGTVALGYPRHSAGFVSGGASTEDSFDEMVSAADRRTGAIADAILEQMSLDGSHARHVLAIWNRYLGDVARFRGNPSELLMAGCAVFLIEARRRGIAA